MSLTFPRGNIRIKNSIENESFYMIRFLSHKCFIFIFQNFIINLTEFDHHLDKYYKLESFELRLKIKKMSVWFAITHKFADKYIYMLPLSQSQGKLNYSKPSSKIRITKTHLRLSSYEKGCKNYQDQVYKTFNLLSTLREKKSKSSNRALINMLHLEENSNFGTQREIIFLKELIDRRKIVEERITRAQSHGYNRRSHPKVSNIDNNMKE